jgi:hypothetical protein
MAGLVRGISLAIMLMPMARLNPGRAMTMLIST